MARLKAIRVFVRRWCGNPFVTVIAFGVLIGDVMVLPMESTVGDLRTRVVVQYIQLIEGRSPVLACGGVLISPPRYTLYAVPEAGKWRLFDPNMESFDVLGTLIESRRHVMYLTAYGIDRTSGFWAPTRHAVGWRINMDWLDDAPVAPQEEDAIRAVLAKHTAPWRRADSVKTTILWAGVAHNAGALFTGAIFLVSLAWVPHAPGWLRERKARRALARGRCPACAYDIRGLSRCPECGRVVPV